MLLRDFLDRGIEALSSLYPRPEARSILLMVCGEWLGTTSYTHIIEPSFPVPEEEESRLEDALLRLQQGEPVQYILGKADFCGRSFHVTPAVLIPRPETEILCREAIALARQREAPAVLDLCTGSGNIAWTLALSVGEARVVAADLSEAALDVARNQPFEADRSPQFIRADILLPPPLTDSFDLILSNPPYVMDSEKSRMRRNVLDYEPASALFVPDEDPLLYYRAIARWSTLLLSASGTGITEINEACGLTVLSLMVSAGFSNSQIIKDFNGKDRFVRYAR